MTNKAEIVAMLGEHEFLKGLPQPYVEKIADFTTVTTYQAKDFLFRTEVRAKHCYLVRSGNVSIEVFHPARGGVTLQTLGPHKVLGWSWLIPPYKWTFDARALELTRVLVVDADELRAAMEEDHEFGYEMLRRFIGVLAERVEAARLQMLDMFGPAQKK